MAPIVEVMEQDVPGFGGFIYKDLYNTPHGKRINYFNCQSYNEYSLGGYSSVIYNGYPASKIVYGMLAEHVQYDFIFILNVLRTIKKKYPDFGGAFIWEYFDAPPDSSDPSKWAIEIYDLLVPQKWWARFRAYYGF